MISENILSMLEEPLGSKITEADENAVLEPLLDMIQEIQDEDIRQFVRACLYCAPPPFWMASSAMVRGFEHPPDEMQPGGNVTHVRRACRFAAQIASAQQLPQDEIDLLMAATLLHDIVKLIEDEDGDVVYQRFYPYLFDDFVLNIINMDKENEGLRYSNSLSIDPEDFMVISRLIRTHQGMNGPVPETHPNNNLEWAIHLADLLAVTVHYLIDEEPKAERWQVE